MNFGADRIYDPNSIESEKADLICLMERNISKEFLKIIEDAAYHTTSTYSESELWVKEEGFTHACEE